MTMEYKPEDSQNSTWLGSNSYSTDSTNKTGSYGEKEISSLTDSQLHHAIHKLQHDPAHQLWLQPVKEEEARKILSALKKADDNHSQTSAETATSDSGRGGSEEDINSNRGHTLSDSEENRSFYTDNLRSGRLAMPRRPPPPIPTDSYQRNISFSDDSVNANTTVASYKAALKSPSLSEFKTPLKLGRELFYISGRTQGDTFLDTQMTTPGMPYSVQDIDDISEMATCRDDASTTTSGSYTINPEELCNEIDELFFKDVIV